MINYKYKNFPLLKLLQYKYTLKEIKYQIKFTFFESFFENTFVRH